MINQCRLFNKILILESANKSYKLQKSIIQSFVEYAIKDGVDGILIKKDNSTNEGFIEKIKLFNRCVVAMELSEDNKKKYEELTK
jgi:hypothetical protein